jgi:hypothetical protein
MVSCLYKKCPLDHIPNRLQWGLKRRKNNFYLGEELYWRCNPNKIDSENPYSDISLFDVSINRQGNPKKPICIDRDVLFNIEGKGITLYEQGIITLKIKELSNPYNYRKKFQESFPNSEDDKIYIVNMELIHKPLQCMFPHSVFQFTFENVAVTKENYGNGFGKSNRTLSKLRQKCKAELLGMIIKEVRF